MIVEKPLAFGRAGTLIGVMCGPAQRESQPTSMPTAVFINAGIIHRVGPNRLYVTLARELARRGVRSLRFDLGGIGDSSTVRDERGSTDEAVYRDVADAIDLASGENPAGVVLIGLCSGADYAFQAATADARVVGALLLDPNVHLTRGFYARHFWRALRSGKTWRLLLTGSHPFTRRVARFTRLALGRDDNAAPFLAPTSLPELNAMRAQMDALLDRGCRLGYVFTGGLPYRYNHERQLATVFPRAGGSDRVTYLYRPDWDHTFSGPEAQSTLAETVGRWYTESFGEKAPHERAG